MAARKKTTKKQNVKVKATITVETSFQSYANEALNNHAIAQIKGWLTEVLNEEEQIPLFVSSQSGEQTTVKKVKVDLRKVGRIR